MSDWIPALSTAGLLAGVLWLARSLILTRLQASVSHEFEGKLVQLRAELSASEERLRGQIRERESEISALRSGALSSLAGRQAMLDKRRLEAIDQLWGSQIALAPARYISTVMSVVKFEEAAKAAETDSRVRMWMEAMGGSVDLKKIDNDSAMRARPFVTPMVWAVHSAIVAITMHSVIRWKILQTSLGAMNLVNDDAVKKLILAVLPHHASYLEKHGPTAFHFVLEELDTRLLKEIQEMLAGNDGDKSAVEQAAKIVKLAGELRGKDSQADATGSKGG